MSGPLGVDLTVAGRLIPEDNLLVKMSEHFDPFVVDYQIVTPKFWRDRIPMGTFPLFNGTSQKVNIFRGSLGPQQGLSEWQAVATSSKAANPDTDYCSWTPQTYSWAFEQRDYSGVRTSWRSPTFCVNDLKFTDKAREQLGMIVKAGAMVVDSVRETFNREQYLKAAVDAGRAMIMCDGGLDYVDNADVRFEYDPSTVDSDGNTYVEFRASLLPSISTLNWSYLDYIRTYMTEQCPDAAMATESGMPVFGLIIDRIDFEKMVYSDPELREDFRQAIPQRLIEGFNMQFKTYRGLSIIHESHQPRFTIQQVYTAGQGHTWAGEEVVRATRVTPRRATRAGTVGYIPEANPAFLTAELAIGVIYLTDVIQVLVPPTVTNMGSGMTFGPAPGFNGDWSWINIRDNDRNPLGEIGHFFARFEYFVRPLQYVNEATIFLYRRCVTPLSTGCLTDVSTGTAAASDAVALAKAPVADDFDGTLCTVNVQLVKRLAGQVGDAVSVKADDGDSFDAVIADSSQAPLYKLAWVSGATNAPVAVTEINDTAVVTVTLA